MILSQPDLREAVRTGQIKFDPPLNEEQWGEASVDLRLGFQFTKLKNVSGMRVSVAQGLKELGDTGFWQTAELKEKDDFGKVQTFCIDPGEFVLAMTYEKISVPKNMIALIEGRSTYARIGLSMHQTAPWIQPGWKGPIVLEIMNHGPLKIDLTPIIDRPCQLTFFQLSSQLPDDQAYGSRTTDSYQEQSHPLQHKHDN
jgi:dCTP deaminase